MTVFSRLATVVGFLILEDGRARKVAAWDERIVQLCGPVWFADLPPLAEGPANDYRLLSGELMKQMLVLCHYLEFGCHWLRQCVTTIAIS